MLSLTIQAKTRQLGKDRITALIPPLGTTTPTRGVRSPVSLVTDVAYITGFRTDIRPVLITKAKAYATTVRDALSSKERVMDRYLFCSCLRNEAFCRVPHPLVKRTVSRVTLRPVRRHTGGTRPRYHLQDTLCAFLPLFLEAP